MHRSVGGWRRRRRRPWTDWRRWWTERTGWWRWGWRRHRRPRTEARPEAVRPRARSAGMFGLLYVQSPPRRWMGVQPQAHQEGQEAVLGEGHRGPVGVSGR